MNNWNAGNEIGKLYFVNEEDNSRVGHCWMNGRLKDGDLVLCLKHAGDYFNHYILVEVVYNALIPVLQSRFGAYRLGTLAEWQPSEAELQLLLSGETIRQFGNEEHPIHKEHCKKLQL